MASKAQKTKAHLLGARGESDVADWYRAAGFTILERNWRCFEGEIDIIAKRGKTLAVCEVKSRASDRFVDPALSVGAAKQSKVRTAAFRWLEQHQRQGQLRFDVALVINGEIRMIEGAF